MSSHCSLTTVVSRWECSCKNPEVIFIWWVFKSIYFVLMLNILTMVSRCWSVCEPLGSSLNFLGIFIVRIKILVKFRKFFQPLFTSNILSIPFPAFSTFETVTHILLYWCSHSFFSSLFLFLRLNDHSWLVSEFMNPSSNISNNYKSLVNVSFHLLYFSTL